MLLQLLGRDGAGKQHIWLSLRQHCRHRHRKAQEVTIRLVEDVPGVGTKGSIQKVARGRMRNNLYPERKALYVTKDEGSSSDLQPIMDFKSQKGKKATQNEDVIKIRTQLESLDSLVLRLPLAVSRGRSNASTLHSILKAPLALGEIVEHLKDAHNVDLESAGHLTLSPKALHIRTTGSFLAFAHFRTGDISMLNIRVEPDIDNKEL